MLLWNIIEKSKKDTDFNSSKQFDNLVEILSQMSREDIAKVEDEWQSTCNKIVNNQHFMKLHIQEGGIVEGGDDTFFMDFANWVVAQGKDLYNDFKNTNHFAIINYIKKNNISRENYTFECFIYAFSDVLKD